MYENAKNTSHHPRPASPRRAPVGPNATSPLDVSPPTGATPVGSCFGCAPHPHAQVCLGFHEKSVKKNFFGFGAKEEKIYWERWIIPITATNVDNEKTVTQAGT